MSSSPAAYGLEYQARCVAPFYQATPVAGVHRFLVGTAHAGGGNKIYLMDFHEQQRVADCTAVWSHHEEIWGMSVSPGTSGAGCLFATFSPASGCRIHRVQGDHDVMGELERLGSIPGEERQVLWDGEGLQGEFRSLSATGISVWKTDGFLSAGGSSSAPPAQRVAFQTPLSSNSGGQQARAANDPHHTSIVAVGAAEGIFVADMREKKVVASAASQPHAPRGQRWIEFSPSTANRLLTTGTDGTIQIWDLRMIAKPSSKPNSKAADESLGPITTLRGHQHYCLGASFHPFHDRLVLSWSSDHTTKLWDLERDAQAGQTHQQHHHNVSDADGINRRIVTSAEKTISEFGESVHSAAWSASGSWTYAAVAFHGKVLVDTVPNDTKMRVLMASQSQPSEDF
ncbi:WD40 repeat-containing protein, putative [Bodo saltans]|uniref:WD40 repeat-containing protein, putative n=1 Tax=Bodo saltans TaxID=75058 RepID=A0A0S4JKW8_BODSA|nr:WD40 repeat-containing protein, putative [Bodo saltans]|eukprot:CUG92196.1 WD40 repeat-containing protein, putative [Bodo saltans]